MFIKLAVEHPVRFQLQCQVNFSGRHGFKEGGPVQVRERVPKTALPGNGFIQNAGGEVGRAFKLHMLHPVRNTGFTRDLIAGANPVPYPLADDGRGVDFFQLDEQPVGEGNPCKGVCHATSTNKELAELAGCFPANGFLPGGWSRAKQVVIRFNHLL